MGSALVGYPLAPVRGIARLYRERFPFAVYWSVRATYKASLLRALCSPKLHGTRMQAKLAWQSVFTWD